MQNEDNLVPVPAPSPYGPLTPSGLLQRTFSLYREQPGLMFGLMLIVACMEALVSGTLNLSAAFLEHGHDVGPQLLQRALFVCVALLAWLLMYLVSQVVHGAYFYAVTAQLERRSIRVGGACSLALGRLGRLIGVSAWVALRIFGYMFLFGLVLGGAVGMVIALVHVAAGTTLRAAGTMGLLLLVAPLAVVALIASGLLAFWLVARYAIAVPACLSEGLSASLAIRRSIHLSAKSRGRIYAMYAFVFLLFCTSMALWVPSMLLAMHNGGHTAGSLLLNAFASAGNLLFGAWLLSYTGIATTLCYYDLRVRKEGLGLMAAGPASGAPSSAPLPPLPPPEILPGA